MKGTYHSLLLQKITEGQSAAEYFSSAGSDPLLQTSKMFYRLVNRSHEQKPPVA
jgi:hypothetical protein